MTQAKDDRKARLAQALRDNLRRRKAQSRASAQAEPSDPAQYHGDTGADRDCGAD
ncbi:MAG: hypothetical protein ABW039_04370 [Sphingobium sp.]